MGKVSRRPKRAARRGETARVFRDGESEVMVTGPVAGEPLDLEGMVDMLESLGAHVRAAAADEDEFVDDEGNEVRVSGPISHNRQAMADAFASIAAELRSRGPLRSNVWLCQVSCPSPLREAA